MRYYFKNGIFASVRTLGDAYNSSEPTVALFLHPSLSFDRRHALEAKSLFPEMNPTIFSHGPTSIRLYGLQFKGNVLRQVIEVLFRKECISASDRADIENDILLFEKSIERRSLISDELSVSQKEAIELILSPYFEGILDQVLDLNLAIKLCGIGMINMMSLDKELVLYQMKVYGIKEEFETSVPSLSIRQEICDCISAISKIYSQEECLLSTFFKLGSHLPHIDSQKKCIAEILLKLVDRKLNKDDPNFDTIIETVKKLLRDKRLSESLLSRVHETESIEEEKTGSSFTM